MKLIRTEDAVGHVLCHDMTQIIKGAYKDARFRKGHVVRREDIPVLLSMGKEHLYVWEMVPGMVHENDAAERLCALCFSKNMIRSQAKEGKIELSAACGGLFRVDSRHLLAVNSIDNIMIATARGTNWREHESSPSLSRRKRSARPKRRQDRSRCWNCFPGS